ncbi:hypothetical protein J6A31_07485 [bacterium]|nr:hypothetical protein [bacterium]
MTKEEKARLKEMKAQDMNFSSYPHLVAIKPREKYIFHSDYFQIDNSYATILSFFHIDGATDGYPAFWGIGRTPSGLDNDITTVSFEQVRRMSKAWIEDHETVAESVATMNNNELNKAGTQQTKQKSNRKMRDLEEIAKELADNASYLQCTFKIMVKAPTLEKLDKAIVAIGRRYMDVFSTLEAAAFMGQQRQELSTLFSGIDKKVGHPYYFTSTEYAGSYCLVTHGMEDPFGEYVGRMFGDVNNSAVLFAVNDFKHHIVVANEHYNEKLNRTPMADYWGSKISQSCLIHNGRVVHIVLDDCDLDLLGPKFENITYKLDMNTGDVNMFEMFGDTKDELSLFAMQMQKLILMAEQAYETTESDRSIIRGSLEEVATKFYIDNRMWYENATTNQDRLRVVNIPHKSVPKLEMFVSYLDTEYKKALAADVKDDERCHALGVLRSTFRNLLSANGDLFNTITNSEIDGAKRGRRVIYDFSKLRRRGEGVAMAQLVNVIGFAVGNLGRGDAVIFHGTERIAHRVKDYITDQLGALYDKGGRAVFLYNNIDKMMGDKKFSHFDRADYTILGTMSPNQVEEYQKSLGQKIPGDLSKLVSIKNPNLAYLRREYTNVIFEQDLLLGMGRQKGVRM